MSFRISEFGASSSRSAKPRGAARKDPSRGRSAVVRAALSLAVLGGVLTTAEAQTTPAGRKSPEAALVSLMFDSFDRIAAHCNQAVPENAQKLGGALRLARASVETAAAQYIAEIGPDAQQVFDPAAQAMWLRQSEDLWATVQRADPKRYCTWWPENLLKMTPEIALGEFRRGYRAVKNQGPAKSEPKRHGAPPEEVVRRFVRLSEVGESTVLAYSATAAMESKGARSKCESETVLASRDIFHEWAAIATRTVFDGDVDGQEVNRMSALLDSQNGRAFLAAKAQMQRDLTNGVPLEQAKAGIRKLLPNLPPEMGPPITRVGEVSQLLADPRRFKQWPRYAEFEARLERCARLR